MRSHRDGEGWPDEDWTTEGWIESSLALALYVGAGNSSPGEGMMSPIVTERERERERRCVIGYWQCRGGERGGDVAYSDRKRKRKRERKKVSDWL